MGKGKLKNLFKKKEGGSVVGNLLRKVGDTVTGGAYSSMFPKPTAADMAKHTGSAVVPQIEATISPQQKSISVEYTPPGEKEPLTKKKWFWPTVAGVALAVIGIVVAIFKRKK